MENVAKPTIATIWLVLKMKPNQESMILGLGIQLSNFKHGLVEYRF
jgi:hypothetical protein